MSSPKRSSWRILPGSDSRKSSNPLAWWAASPASSRELRHERQRLVARDQAVAPEERHEPGQARRRDRATGRVVGKAAKRGEVHEAAVIQAAQVVPVALEHRRVHPVLHFDLHLRPSACAGRSVLYAGMGPPSTRQRPPAERWLALLVRAELDATAEALRGPPRRRPTRSRASREPNDRRSGTSSRSSPSANSRPMVRSRTARALTSNMSAKSVWTSSSSSRATGSPAWFITTNSSTQEPRTTRRRMSDTVGFRETRSRMGPGRTGRRSTRV